MIELLQNNWVWIALVGLFVFMQASGMGCCGHGGHKSHGGPKSKPDRDQEDQTQSDGQRG